MDDITVRVNGPFRNLSHVHIKNTLFEKEQRVAARCIARISIVRFFQHLVDLIMGRKWTKIEVNNAEIEVNKTNYEAIANMNQSVEARIQALAEQYSLNEAVTPLESCATPDKKIFYFSFHHLVGEGSSKQAYSLFKFNVLKDKLTPKVLLCIDENEKEVFEKENTITHQFDNIHIARRAKQVAVINLKTHEKSSIWVQKRYKTDLWKLRDLGALKEEEEMRFAKEILEGVQVVHQKEFLHCDLKPENIFISERNNEQHAVIGDFGLAHKIGQPWSNDDEESKLYLNASYPYWPPKATRAPLEAFDLWGIGMTLYKMHYGEVPNWGEVSSQQTIDSDERLQVDPSRIAKLIKGFLKYNPEERLSIDQALKLINNREIT